MGPSNGGTEVFLLGKKFPNITNTPDNVEFNCKFTPEHLAIQPKIMPAKFINDTAIMCSTPGGWAEGDKMHLQVTFNGGDYDQNGYEFTFYSIAKVTPRSGPSDGKGGPIIVSGQGFR